MINYTLISALTGWFIAQLLKVIFCLISHKKLDLKKFIQSGGMPSSHSALVTGLAVSIGFTEGFNSNLFSICFALAVIVMYDAAGVRRAAGQQAKVINKMTEAWENGLDFIQDKKLKEFLGHTPIEVIAGAILGCVIAVVYYFVLYESVN